MERIKEWDFIKGILIICVIYGHISSYLTAPSVTDTTYSPTVFIRLFQMPLFVLVSGMFSKVASDFKNFITIWRKYLKRLLIPFIVWCIVLIFLKSLAIGETANNFNSLIRIIAESCGILWFIPMLIISHFVFTTYTLLFGPKAGSSVGVIILMSAFILVSLIVPRDFCNFLFLFPFYCIGRLMKNIDYNSLTSKNWGGRFLLSAIILIAVSFLFPADLTFYHLSNSVLISGFSFSLILFVFIRYICYSVVTLSALYILLVLFNKVSVRLSDVFSAIGKERTLFLYLSHISFLYYTLRVLIIENDSTMSVILGNQFVRYYLVSILGTIIVVILLNFLFKILNKNKIFRLLFIG